MSERRWVAAALFAVVAVGAAACSEGNASVAGLGNDGTRIYANQILDEVVDVLADSPQVPKVSDEMLVQGFESIRSRASEGDPEAVLILFQVAERQRNAKKR